jgi:Tol biopolymer transport system component
MMGSARSGNLDLYVSTRNTTSDVWSSPVELAEIDSAMNDTNPFLTRDRLTLYFDSDRSGNRELYVTSRPTTSATFSQPTAIDELNTGNADGDPWVSRDGHHVFFSSNRSGANAIYEAER